MKRIITFLLVICAVSMLICSCGAKKNSTDTRSSDAKPATVSIEDMQSLRPVWEGLLYSTYKAGDAEDADICPLALAYTLSHYSYGEKTTEHSDKLTDNASVTRDELSQLARAASFDELPSDDALSEYFDIQGDTFTVKSIEFDAAQYNMTRFFISGSKAVADLQAGDTAIALTLYFTLDDTSLNGIRIEKIETAA